MGRKKRKPENVVFGETKYCPHCKQNVSKRTFYDHRNLFFIENQWRTVNDRRDSENDTESEVVESTPDSVFNINMVNEGQEDSLAEEDNSTEMWVSPNSPEDDFEDHNINNVTPMIQKVFLSLLLLWQNLFKVSDNALAVLLGILNTMLNLFFVESEAFQFNPTTDKLPQSTASAKKFLNITDSFQKYVCCSSCSTIYKYSECIELTNNQKHSKKCSRIPFPNHPQERFRQPCGSLLMKKVSLSPSKISFYPYKVYVYQPLKVALNCLLQRTEIVSAIKAGLEYGEGDVMYDVNDGQIWRHFKDCDGNFFYQNVRNLAGILNVDWFQPYSNVQHSIGVIYIALLNLPREIRFKQENIIIVGIIPGPKEPENTINSFLSPLIDELLSFWSGVYLQELGEIALYRFALLCISSDLPAARKCCGFLSYNAFHGCSKCLKTFPRAQFGDKPDFSGFKVDDWVLREFTTHYNVCQQYLLASTKSQQAELEYENGCRYSILLKLPYFDIIRFHVIDPMHNLLLGIAKHVFVTWIDMGIVTKELLNEIDKDISNIELPSEIGRLSGSIHYFKTFKADEWKNWTFYISLYALRNRIPRDHFNMWQVFVRGCRLVLTRSITKEEIQMAHSLFVLFCQSYERICGKEKCVPNMHMMLHLRECILDYGPVYTFWLFSFERYNGILGKYNTNNHSITIQLMRKFTNGLSLISSFEKLDTNISLNEIGLLSGNMSCHSRFFESLRRHPISNIDHDFVDIHVPLSVPSISVLSTTDIESIKKSFDDLWSIPVSPRRFVKVYKRIQIGCDILTSEEYRSGNTRNSNILVKTNIPHENRPAKIKQIFIADITNINNVEQEAQIGFFRVGFYKSHEQKGFYGTNCPLQVWSILEDEEIIPFHFYIRKCVKIRCQCAFTSNLGIIGNDIVNLIC